MSTSNTSVQTLVRQLLGSNEAMIRATVANNPAAVKDHWSNVTDRLESANRIADQLVAMWNAGKRREVISVINVPFIQGKGDLLDQAWSYMRGEVAEMSNDTGNGAMQRALRMGPVYNFGSDEDSPAQDAPASSSSDDDSSDSGFNWTVFLQTLPGLVSAFSQGSGSNSAASNNASNGGAGQPPARTGVPTWLWVVGGVVAVALAIWGVTKLVKSN